MRRTTDHQNAVLFQALISHSQQAMERLGIPGAAIGLLTENQEFVAGLGVTSLEDPQSATPETIYQWLFCPLCNGRSPQPRAVRGGCLWNQPGRLKHRSGKT